MLHCWRESSNPRVYLGKSRRVSHNLLLIEGLRFDSTTLQNLYLQIFVFCICVLRVKRCFHCSFSLSYLRFAIWRFGSHLANFFLNNNGFLKRFQHGFFIIMIFFAWLLPHAMEPCSNASSCELGTKTSNVMQKSNGTAECRQLSTTSPTH